MNILYLLYDVKMIVYSLETIGMKNLETKPRKTRFVFLYIMAGNNTKRGTQGSEYT